MAFNFSFGAPAPAPAPAPAAFSFGGFGAPAPAPAPAPAAAFSFGAPAPAPAPAAGGFSFGAPAPAPAPAPAFSFSLGGAAAPAPAPAPAAAGFGGFSLGGSFGAPAPAPAPAAGGFSFGSFGAPAAPAPAPAVAAPQQQPQPKDKQDALIEAVVPLLNKYAAQDAGPLADVKRLLQGLYKSDPYTYRFKAVAYNVRDPTSAYLRPPLLTQEEWDTHCAAHGSDDSTTPPLPLIPVPLDGFDGVGARMDAQDAQVKEFARSAEHLLAAVATIRLGVERSNDRLAGLRAKQAALHRRLLVVGTKVEGVISRGKPELPEEAALRAQLAALREALAAGDGVPARLEALTRTQRAREEEAAVAGGASSSAAGSSSVGDLDGLKRQLEAQRSGIEQLLAVVRRDARDLRIVRSHVTEADAAAKARAGESAARASVLGYGPPPTTY